jgi:hypothetical protein
MRKATASVSKKQLRRRIKNSVNTTLSRISKPHANPQIKNSERLHKVQPKESVNLQYLSVLPQPLALEIVDSHLNEEQESDLSELELNCEGQEEFKKQIQRWSLEFGIQQTAVSSLLKILKSHECLKNLPSDSRALLSTKRNFLVREVLPGSYVHFGFTNGLNRYLRCVGSLSLRLNVLISVDGIPISNSSKSEFWPILCRVNESERPFCVGIYHGTSKPDCQNDYLKDFVDEVKVLLQQGFIHENQTLEFCLSGFICDAPARAFITCTKYHSGFSACSKCTQVGERYENRTVFSSFIPCKRDDNTFRSTTDDHFRGATILSELNFGLVSRIPFEFMHLICLGVVKKLVNLWIGGKPKYCKFNSAKIAHISKKLVQLKPFICSDFNRQPRILAEVPRWKATEFRQFLLYTGVVVLHGELPQEYFNHFLSLHCAVSILVDDKLLKDYSNYADKLLNYFVKNFETLYGKENLSYNVHGLLHVCDDVKTFGNLNKYSAFCFENYLGQLKRLVRSGNRPLAQICRRLSELENLEKEEKVFKPTSHLNGPLTFGVVFPVFKTFKINSLVFKINHKDCFCSLEGGLIIKIENFATSVLDNSVHVVGRPFLQVESLYQTPCDSKILKIFRVSEIGRRSHWPVNQIKLKYLVLPFLLDSFAAFPLHHCQ